MARRPKRKRAPLAISRQSFMSFSDAARAIRAGGRFLLDAQGADGAWRDFNLPPGRADAWTTAYIGLKLSSLPSDGRKPSLAGALSAAADFLAAARNPGGGWRYNSSCPPDADSTALALLFLCTVGKAVRAKDVAALAKFQKENGGFSTYLFGESGHGWRRAHCEVTATALRALSACLPHDHFRIRHGLGWLHEQLRKGSAQSYWWPSPLYLAAEIARARKIFPELPQARAPVTVGSGAFELSLGLELQTASCDMQVSETCRRLIRMQLQDGSWPAAPILRVTNPGGGDGLSGPILADDRRFFTTATAVGALQSATAHNVEVEKK